MLIFYSLQQIIDTSAKLNYRKDNNEMIIDYQVLSIRTKDKAKKIMEYYNAYGLHVAGNINDTSCANLIEYIEKKYDIDSIQLHDGTRIWNLIRIFIRDELSKLQRKQKREGSHLYLIPFIKESILPLSLPTKKGMICGFSSTESRKQVKEKYYDIYLDPLYEILNDDFAVFEWPSESGRRRKYEGNVYSKTYIPMHIPIYTKTFWNILFYKIGKRKRFRIIHEKILLQIIDVMSDISKVEKIVVKNKVYEFITIFYHIKQLLHSILVKIKPKAVLIRCGYGRFPMALSQACRELNIPSIELQHGLITANHPAYTKNTSSKNRDCTPEYLLTHGDIFSNLVQQGRLFDKNKVVTVGFPFLEQRKKELQKKDYKQKKAAFDYSILFTSQWIAADEIQVFITKSAQRLQTIDKKIVIIFKPHPYDNRDYSSLERYKNITLADRYEDIFTILPSVDIHATVYSISGLEAMTFGKPNLFVDVHNISGVDTSSMVVRSPDQFITAIKRIIAEYEQAVDDTYTLSDIFFKKDSLKNMKKFFSAIDII